MLPGTPTAAAPSLPSMTTMTTTPTARDSSLTKHQHKRNQHHRRTRSMSSMDPDLIAQLQADRKALAKTQETSDYSETDPTLLARRGRLANLNEETKSLTDEEQDEILRERLSRRRVSFDLSRNVVLTLPASVPTSPPLSPLLSPPLSPLLSPPLSPRLSPVNTSRELLRTRTLGLSRGQPGSTIKENGNGERPFIPLTPVRDDYEDSEIEEWLEVEETDETNETSPTTTSMAATMAAALSAATAAVERKCLKPLAHCATATAWVHDTLRIMWTRQLD